MNSVFFSVSAMKEDTDTENDETMQMQQHKCVCVQPKTCEAFGYGL